MTPTVGIANGKAALHECLDLRDAEAGRHARRAAAARPDADLHAVRSEVDQKTRAFGRGHVAGDDLEVAEPLAKLLHRPLHHDRMPVGDVDHQHVDLRLDQLGGTLEIVTGRADRCANHQTPVRVARRERQLSLAADIPGRYEAGQTAGRIDQRQLLDLPSDHQALGLFMSDRPLVDDELLARRHAFLDARPSLGDESNITVA